MDKVAKRLLYSLRRAQEDATDMNEVGGDVRTIISKQEYMDVQLHKRMDKVEGLINDLAEVIMKGQHPANATLDGRRRRTGGGSSRAEA